MLSLRKGDRDRLILYIRAHNHHRTRNSNNAEIEAEIEADTDDNCFDGDGDADLDADSIDFFKSSHNQAVRNQYLVNCWCLHESDQLPLNAVYRLPFEVS